MCTYIEPSRRFRSRPDVRSDELSLLAYDVVGDVDEPINGNPGDIVNAPKFDDDDALDAFESMGTACGITVRN